ncbi:hypothetical protein NAEGRDRAFT_70688 [Naegleria gruberi]|uniref:RGS domain-containing protein n=1 Tax=Naegleria gruberi TaxID=5762 RepID=D2VP09_NAEGR|nr:uncharacterized protein NAEGRDRAFT_70688 [Naegleria gruberi]EFC41580.1 hypothetical protein NAEGRDRAFT_70688 [Naegleria gruberi]|eukprot:XP_002674324.1 hypothetical protein NAEGRDRAFT_70688 [Naegleria gruberi strain NEG-M]
MRKYDSILLDPYIFSFYVRFYRDVQMTDGKFMETSDFVAFPLIPYEVYSFSTIKSLTLDSSLFDYEQTSCLDGPDVSDAQNFRWLSGYSNFSQTDLLIIQGVTGRTQISANYSIISQQVGKFSSNFTDLSYYSISSLLLPSTCYMCETSGCFGEDFSPVLDYWIIPQFLIVFSYFVLFFGLKLYKKPAMIRRIGLPYCSLLGFSLMITFTGLSRTCVGFWYSVSLLVMIWWFFIYITTIAQFYFLRNLYSLIVRFPKREKLLKMMASKKGGFLMTVVMTFFLSIIVNCVSTFFFINEDKSLADIYRPVVILVLLILLWIIGLVSVIYDVITQRKSIIRDGLRKFFFYDDPFYLRVDLLTLILPVIIAITSGLENLLVDSSNTYIVQILAGIFNTLACFSFTLLSGGNVLIIEIYKMIANRNVKKNESLEIELENSEILKIFKEYCQKEFSSENYELYIILKSLKESNVVRLTDMKDIESQFIQPYSKFEVNIPSVCKKEFYALMKDCDKDGQIGYERLWDCLGPDLLLNLSDTFKRLQETSTYKKWESVQSYTKHITDVNP